jgi:hypothetical protein
MKTWHLFWQSDVMSSVFPFTRLVWNSLRRVCFTASRTQITASICMMLGQAVLGRVVLFEMDDPLWNGNLDSGVTQRRIHRDGYIALHKGKTRHVFSRKPEHEDQRVFAELL